MHLLLYATVREPYETLNASERIATVGSILPRSARWSFCQQERSPRQAVDDPSCGAGTLDTPILRPQAQPPPAVGRPVHSRPRGSIIRWHRHRHRVAEI